VERKRKARHVAEPGILRHFYARSSDLLEAFPFCFGPAVHGAQQALWTYFSKDTQRHLGISLPVQRNVW
jgi:hypothetical protein